MLAAAHLTHRLEAMSRVPNGGVAGKHRIGSWSPVASLSCTFFGIKVGIGARVLSCGIGLIARICPRGFDVLGRGIVGAVGGLVTTMICGAMAWLLAHESIRSHNTGGTAR